MRVASLFTGAGGLDVGLEEAGHTIILQCEGDPGAQQVLKQRFPGTLLVSDICSLAALPQETEILAAGFPCIDVSRAGLRRGLDGQSTCLVRHVFRLLETSLKDNRGIQWVLLENVEGLLDRINGQPPVIQYIAEQFEQLGYASWAHRIINTASFGVPNRRKRVFMVASLYGDARDVLLSQGVICKGACYQLFNGKPCYSCHQAHGPDGTGRVAPDCTYALDLSNAQSGPGLDMVPTFKTGNGRICLLLKSGQLGALRTEDAERLQGFEDGYTLPCFPIQGPGASLHGSPRLREGDLERREAHRWALLGNAVSVPVAAWLGQCLANPFRHKYYLGSKDRKFITTDPRVPQGGPQKRHRREADWTDDEYFIMPAEELYEFSIQEDSGKEAGGDGAGSAPEAAPTTADPSPSVETASPSTAASVQADKAPLDEAVISKAAADEAAVVQAAAEKKQRLLDFQFDVMRQTSRKAQPTAGPSALRMDDRMGWPRTAWFVRGLGRHAAEGVSEAPTLTPLTLLGDFVTGVGKAPEKEALTTYFARLREQGFNMEDVLQRAQECGASLNQEAVQIFRLPGYTSDVDTLGRLVWARNLAGVWWPGEALDPYHMPPTRTVPPLAAAALTSAEYKASIFRQSGQTPPPPMCIGSALKEGADVQHGGAGAALTGGGAGADVLRTPVLRDTTSPSKRKVLVLFFGERCCMWHPPAQLLPFKRHLHEKLADGNELIAAKKIARPGLFKRAVQEAKGLAEMVAAAARGDKGPHQEALAALAAMRAAAANLRVRCGFCEACLATQGAARRCLVNRAAAAAAAGHSGAQVAVTGESALGARVSVWWPMDEDWYTGSVTAFDPMSQRHSVCYDDGDVEIVALWAPNQLVRVETNPDEWPAVAERIAQDNKLCNATYQAKKRADRAAAQESATTFSTEPLNWFEQQRADNIARNRSMLAKLAFPLAAPAATATASVNIAVQGGHAAGKEIRLARDSKGRFIGSSGSSEWRRKHAKIDSEQCTSSGVRLPITVKSSSDGSVVIVPVVEGSLAVACDMATWAQKCNVSMQAPSIPQGEDLDGCTTSSNEQAALSCIVAGRALERLPEASTGGQMEAPQASAEALANLGCEIWLAGIPSEAVRENLFGVSKAKNWKKKRRLNAELQPAT